MCDPVPLGSGFVRRIQQAFRSFGKGGVPIVLLDTLSACQQEGQGLGRPTVPLWGSPPKWAGGQGIGTVSCHQILKGWMGRRVQSVQHGMLNLPPGGGCFSAHPRPYLFCYLTRVYSDPHAGHPSEVLLPYRLVPHVYSVSDFLWSCLLLQPSHLCRPPTGSGAPLSGRQGSDSSFMSRECPPNETPLT